MLSRSEEMQIVFSKLSEKNKEIVLLVAKSVKIAQEVNEQLLRQEGEDVR